MAMAGKNCVAIAVDKRFGSGPQMINIIPRTVLIPHSKVMIGLVGLEGDVQSLAKEVSIQISTKVGRHLGFGGWSGSASDSGRAGSSSMDCDMQISPKSASMLMSHMLYRRRNSPYYVEPIIAGLQEITTETDAHNSEASDSEHDIQNENILERGIGISYKPFLSTQDCIGAQSKSTQFVCTGAASKSLYGTAEAMWRPDLEPEELIQVLGRAFLSAMERDCLSGYGAVLYLMVGGRGVERIELASRND